MAGTLQFDLVSPERRLASLEAIEVQIPGADGDMTAMADHAATITTLRPGVLRVVTSDGVQEFAVTGGFAEITGSATTVLAEQAMPVAEATAEVLDGLIAGTEAAAQGTEGAVADAAAKTLADMQALKAHLGH